MYVHVCTYVQKNKYDYSEDNARSKRQLDKQIQCKSIDNEMRYGRYNKRSYNTLKILTKSLRRATSIIEDSIGNPLSEDSSDPGLNTSTTYIIILYNLMLLCY